MLATEKLASSLLLALLFLAPTGFAADKEVAKKTEDPTKSSDTKPDVDDTTPDTPSDRTTEKEEPTAHKEPSSSLALTVAPRQKDTDKDASGAKDTGFYLRATLGGGHAWGHAEKTATQSDLAMQALGGAVMLQPGYQLLPGLAVHGDLYASMLFAHRLRSENEDAIYEAKKIGLIAPTVGVGMTYHSLPDDLFVSAGAGVSAAFGSRWLNIGPPGVPNIVTEPAMTNPGFAAQGSVGKLFSVHQRWAVGGALNYNFQTFGATDDAILTVKRAHSLWLGFTTAFHPAR